ncbi:MAG: DUF1592 domain-containing protein [Planctomycetota bacterium]
MIRFPHALAVLLAMVGPVGLTVSFEAFAETSTEANATSSIQSQEARAFLVRYCQDCHADGEREGGFDLESLSMDITDEATFARWTRVLDRVQLGEMPPPDADTIAPDELRSFVTQVQPVLANHHQSAKGTTLRRLNRNEYQNTLNDLFGTNLDLRSTLPEEGRSHEFENIGDALGMSMVHLQKYLDAADATIDAAISPWESKPPQQTITASYAQTREGERFIGELWKKLGDDAVVFFQNFGYPTGMLRETSVSIPGRYRIRITGYAYQSDEPITFRVGGTSFVRGSDKPTYGYAQLPPGDPTQVDVTVVEMTADIAERMMLTIDPWGLYPVDYNIRTEGVDGYTGPGLAIRKVELIGPIIEEFPSRGQRLLWDEFDVTALPKRRSNSDTQYQVTADDPLAAMTRTLLRLGRLALRRPVTPAELKPYLELFERERLSKLKQIDAPEKSADVDLQSAIKTSVTALLCSPDFLYLVEPPGKLSDHALAARLSYFLTRSSPDQWLRESANAGLLTDDPGTLLSQTQRLLRDHRAERFINDFTDAWLNLREIDFTSPDQKLFPEFDKYLRDSMIRETRQYVSRMIDENLPVSMLVDSDFAMLNERLARHYGIDGVEGPEIRPVALPPGHIRGGLLTQASVLKVSANGTNTSPVVRGVYVMERILGQRPQPPPPGIPGVEPDIRGASTLRQLLDQHRDMDSCRSCHRQIDPPGFALECFNPIGGYRDRFRSLGVGESVRDEINGRRVRYKLGPAVDASGELADGRQFDDFQAFRELLLANPDVLARAMLTKLATFATGREMGFSDRETLDQLVIKTRGGGMTDLIEAVVLSDLFQFK